jgi:uroporphyrinogen-III synthase
VIPLVVIRPQPGCDASVDAAMKLGLEGRGFPLFEVRPCDWELPQADAFDALLVGSANALRHGGAALNALKGRPAYAVGETTARASREVGLEVVATGEGGLQQVLSRLDPAHRRLLRLTGAARVALDPPPGVTVIERIVYASEPVPMLTALAGLLHEPAVIMLHSAEAARHFRQQCEAHAIDIGMHALACIGPRVADAAGAGWRAVRAATAPSEEALLALCCEMCKEGADGRAC